MPTPFDEARFLALWRSADEALQLQARAREVLAQRQVQSFDGLGHLLDSVLPDDPARLSRLTEVLRLPIGALGQLRASELDPLQLPRETLALIGRITGLDFPVFVELAKQDHARFVPDRDRLASRAATDSADHDGLAELATAWQRLEEDTATDL